MFRRATIAMRLVGCVIVVEIFNSKSRTSSLNYILHEFLANRSYFFAKGSAEHHYLLAVRGVAVDFLYIPPHIWKKNGL